MKCEYQKQISKNENLRNSKMTNDEFVISRKINFFDSRFFYYFYINIKSQSIDELSNQSIFQNRRCDKKNIERDKMFRNSSKRS